MKILHAIFLAAACVSLSSCASFDPLQRAADEADREGGRAARRHDGSNTLDSAFQVAETLYYSKKYPGSPEQIQKAIARGRLAVSQWRGHALPKYLVVGIGKSESTGRPQAMIYDTCVEDLDNINIYEFSNTFKKDTMRKLDGRVAQCVP
jgi:hypothetical protein